MAKSNRIILRREPVDTAWFGGHIYRLLRRSREELLLWV
jgi:hypothetical protein